MMSTVSKISNKQSANPNGAKKGSNVGQVLTRWSMRLRILQSHQDTSISYILISSYLFHLILSILISYHPSLLYIDLDTRSTITNHHNFIRHFSALGHLGHIHLGDESGVNTTPYE